MLLLDMKKSRRSTILKILGFVVLMAVMVWVSTLIDPVALVESMGEEWVYVVLFLSGLVTGVSTFTSGPFYLALIVAISGGLNPFLVALVVAPAISITDLVFLGLVSTTTDLISEKAKWLRKFDEWLDKQPHWIIKTITFLYFAIAPVSSDIFLSLLGLANIKPKDIYPYVFIGNIIFFIWLGFLVQSGSPFVEKIIA